MTPPKQRRIMQAAEHLFRLHRFHEITLDAVAKEANVGKGTIYLYFADKDDLFFQTAMAGFDDMCLLLLGQPVAPGESFAESLQAVCRTISDFFRKRRPLIRMIQAEDEHASGRGGSLRRRWLRQRDKLTKTVAEVIGRGVALNEIRSSAPPEVLAEYLLGMLRTRARELEGAARTDASHATLIDLFLDGAAAGHNGRKHE